MFSALSLSQRVSVVSWVNGISKESSHVLSQRALWRQVDNRFAYTFCSHCDPSTLRPVSMDVNRTFDPSVLRVERWEDVVFYEEKQDVFDFLKDVNKRFNVMFSWFRSEEERSEVNGLGGDKWAKFSRERMSLKVITKDRKVERSFSVSTIGRLSGVLDVLSQWVEEVEEELSVPVMHLDKVGEVVLDNSLTGVFTHEVVGHAAEADLVLKGESCFREQEGRLVNEDFKFDIVDEPYFLDFGFTPFDEEGFVSRPVFIIKNSTINEFLSSSEYGVGNGHGRAQDLSTLPIVRMTNTLFKPRQTSDVFYDEVLYLKGFRGGSVDTASGEFMFAAQVGLLVREGEVVGRVNDVSFSGNVWAALGNIVGADNTFRTSPGYCGKDGQSVPVTDGGSRTRLRKDKGVRVAF